ncbi:MAG: hypothetical protein ACRBF0_19675 [Calditrichia bacterium]
MRYLVTILLVFLLAPGLQASTTKVVLMAGADVDLTRKLETSLTDVLNTVNSNYDLNGPLDRLSTRFSENAFQKFQKLSSITRMYAERNEYRLLLTTTEEGHYEVRDVVVRVDPGSTQNVPFQNLVFVFNSSGIIVNVYFAIETHHYRDILGYGKAVQDLANREKILFFLELYRSAYSSKDVDFIRSTLSDNALIIVGQVVEEREATADFLNKSSLSRDKINFIRLEKSSYLQRLSKVFKQNDFVHIEFDQVRLQRHPNLKEIYGIQLKQRWNSSNYTDEGYLFLMIDFKNPEEPMIHVRAWQPQVFEDDSTISIYDFELLPGVDTDE